jgi:hypothetical protein
MFGLPILLGSIFELSSIPFISPALSGCSSVFLWSIPRFVHCPGVGCTCLHDWGHGAWCALLVRQGNQQEGGSMEILT